MLRAGARPAWARNPSPRRRLAAPKDRVHAGRQVPFCPQDTRTYSVTRVAQRGRAPLAKAWPRPCSSWPGPCSRVHAPLDTCAFSRPRDTKLDAFCLCGQILPGTLICPAGHGSGTMGCLPVRLFSAQRSAVGCPPARRVSVAALRCAMGCLLRALHIFQCSARQSWEDTDFSGRFLQSGMMYSHT